MPERATAYKPRPGEVVEGDFAFSAEVHLVFSRRLADGSESSPEPVAPCDVPLQARKELARLHGTARADQD